jgi:hypothetical protein
LLPCPNWMGLSLGLEPDRKWDESIQEATRGGRDCVTAGLVPAIHDFASLQQRRLDARDKLGHEEAGPESVI